MPIGKKEKKPEKSKTLSTVWGDALDHGGMYYTAQSGIWQSVWMETVPERFIKDVYLETETSLESKAGDIKSVHNYFQKQSVPLDMRAKVISQYGGLVLRVDGHSMHEITYDRKVCKI